MAVVVYNTGTGTLYQANVSTASTCVDSSDGPAWFPVVWLPPVDTSTPEPVGPPPDEAEKEDAEEPVDPPEYGEPVGLTAELSGGESWHRPSRARSPPAVRSLF